MKLNRKNLRIRGHAFWAQVKRPNPVANAYMVDLAVSEETANKLIAEGLSPSKRSDGTAVVHPGHEGKHVFRFKRKVHSRDGKLLGPVLVVDSKNKPTSVDIGNGSEVEVAATLYEYVAAGKKGIAGGLNSIQIIDLVRFEKSPFSVKEGGFVDEGTAASSEDEELELI